jgi:hypothetical protein
MARQNVYKKAIPRLYKRGHLEVTLFTWIQCTKSMFPTVSIEESLKGWYKHFGIEEKDYPHTTASKTYNRMQEELLYIDKDEEDNRLDSK